ncbi:MAG: radical SAM protein [Candidatus Thorarchaeota archaeon]
MTFDILTDGQVILQAPSEELDGWMKTAFQTRLGTFGRDFTCFSPTAYPHNIPEHQQKSPHNFVSLSVTGTSCSLNCEHCQGRLLKGMEPTLTPDALFQRCEEVRNLGGEGVLISGGSDSKGHVPLLRFGDVIRRVKQELGLEVVVHTGLVDEDTAQSLANAGVDAAMLDVIGDETVSENVYHISEGPHKMRRSLDLLESLGIPTVPHVLVGLDYGRLRGEIEALEMIAQGTPSAIVIIALSPVRRTPMEGIAPPSPEDIGRVMTIARLGFADIPVLLGCARPMGSHKIMTDKYGVLSGMNGIAMISQEGVEFAKEKGLRPLFADVCCSLAYQSVG